MTAKNQHGRPSRIATSQPKGRANSTNLSYRYGTIGIQAVAAAARYSDVRKKPTQAPNRIDLRFVEAN